MVKPVKFTRDSGCLARDEFLVISEGDRMLIYIFVIFFLLLGTVLYFYFICRPMLVHRMTLVSFRLFRKHLDNLREFGQMVHRPPPPLVKNCPYAYVYFYWFDLRIRRKVSKIAVSSCRLPLPQMSCLNTLMKAA